MTTRQDRSLAPSTAAALLRLHKAVEELETAWAAYSSRWPFNADCARSEGVQLALYGMADGSMVATVDAGPDDDLVLVERLRERVGSYTSAGAAS